MKTLSLIGLFSVFWLALPSVCAAQEASVSAESSDEVSSDFRLRARTFVPLVSAEFMNGEYGINVLLGGSIGVDIVDLVVIEVGGSWLDYDPGAYDLFGRAGVMWIPLDTRNDEFGPDPSAGWQMAVPFLAGYRFLHDADSTEGGIEGSTDIHAVTASVGWQATHFWSDGWGLEFRFLPTLSIPLSEDQSGEWGTTVPPMEGSTGLSVPETIGHTDDMSWGIDLELTVGVAY